VEGRRGEGCAPPPVSRPWSRSRVRSVEQRLVRAHERPHPWRPRQRRRAPGPRRRSDRWAAPRPPTSCSADRVATRRTLGLEHSRGLLLRPVVGPQDDRLVAGLGGGDQDPAPPSDRAVRVLAVGGRPLVPVLDADNNTRTSQLPCPQLLAWVGNSATRPTSCGKPPRTPYAKNGAVGLTSP
jgi:hypothetical protein